MCSLIDAGAGIVLRRGKSRSVTDIGGRTDEGEAKDCGCNNNNSKTSLGL
ncbi:MAG: hypothetical protein IKP95_05630 [Ruminococcus sp.]|nr:hypothetical protein [Ruminococcus sp.]